PDRGANRHEHADSVTTQGTPCHFPDELFGRMTPISASPGRPEPEIANMLQYARQYLRQKLKESGCRFK
ncbi:MAG TPA: hypothetical protein VE422_40000, partial [Terriglobia bacterium]|nr:hypothetical protein [Terriglobia bacterium]